MALATYAHVLTTATSNGFGTTEKNIFDEDNYSSYTKEVSSNGVTYNSTTGQFTVGSAGSYYVLAAIQTLVTSNLGATEEVTWRVNLDGSEVAAGEFVPNATYGVEENTFQTVVTATTGQNITITLQDNSGTDHGLTAQKNSSVFVFKAENDFGILTRTSNSTATTDTYNVYATASGGSVIFSSGSGAIVEDDSGNGYIRATTGIPSIIINTGYYAIASNAPSVTNSLIVNGLTINNYVAKTTVVDDPIEMTQFGAYPLQPNDNLTITSDTNQYAHWAATGSALSAIGLKSGTHYSFLTVKANSNNAASNTEFDIYKSDSYSSYDSFGFHTGSSYNNTTGEFTIARDGNYIFLCSNYFQVGGDTDISFKIKKNGSEVSNILFRIDASGDPAERTHIGLLENLIAGDTINLFASGTANTLRANAGTSLVLAELIGEPAPTPPAPPAVDPETKISIGGGIGFNTKGFTSPAPSGRVVGNGFKTNGF